MLRSLVGSEMCIRDRVSRSRGGRESVEGFGMERLPLQRCQLGGEQNDGPIGHTSDDINGVNEGALGVCAQRGAKRDECPRQEPFDRMQVSVWSFQDFGGVHTISLSSFLLLILPAPLWRRLLLRNTAAVEKPFTNQPTRSLNIGNGKGPRGTDRPGNSRRRTGGEGTSI